MKENHQDATQTEVEGATEHYNTIVTLKRAKIYIYLFKLRMGYKKGREGAAGSCSHVTRWRSIRLNALQQRVLTAGDDQTEEECSQILEETEFEQSSSQTRHEDC